MAKKERSFTERYYIQRQYNRQRDRKIISIVLLVLIALVVYYMFCKIDAKYQSYLNQQNITKISYDGNVDEIYPYDPNNLVEIREYNRKLDELKKESKSTEEYLEKVDEFYTKSIMDKAAILVQAESEYIGNYTITAYCPCEICCGQYSHTNYAIGSSGKKLQPNHSVASPLPLNTKVIINGHIYTVEDTTADYIVDRYNNKIIDIYFNSHDEALKFGKQNNVPVYKL